MQIISLAALSLYFGASEAHIRGLFSKNVEEPVTRRLLDPSCSATPTCSHLADDCCPSADGVYLDCCFQTCESHSACSQLDGDCCPTSDGTMLDCCFELQSCDANSACAAEGLDGNCCPSDDGVYLDCCDTVADNIPSTGRNPPVTLPPQAQASDMGAACIVNPVCALEGLTGACCPSNDGVYLDCCSRSCAAHNACSHLGDAPCCPTNDGVELDCCDHQPALEAVRQSRNANTLCSAHAACADLGEGPHCCPTADGIFLDCCN